MTSDTELRGMVIGNLTVSQGTLILTGVVCRDLYVEEHGIVELRGMVGGDAVNRGGRLHIYGMVKGRVNDLGGETSADPQAKIGWQ